MATEYRATHRFARIAPRKARYVMDLVRRKPVDTALETLRFTHNRGASMISKVIRSAVANAVQEGGVEPEDLRIERAYVDEGPTWKRWRPRARGSAFPILKRTSHIHISVIEESGKNRKSAAAPASDEKKE